jgi:hypothetical protein
MRPRADYTGARLSARRRSRHRRGCNCFLPRRGWRARWMRDNHKIDPIFATKKKARISDRNPNGAAPFAILSSSRTWCDRALRSQFRSVPLAVEVECGFMRAHRADIAIILRGPRGAARGAQLEHCPVGRNADSPLPTSSLRQR